MSWITWKAATNPQYEELVEKATSPLNLPYPESEDIALNLEICDLIRSKTVPAKPAMQTLKTRLASKNGRVVMSAMGLIDTCIKNGGDHFLLEIASKEFVDEMMGLIKSPSTIPQVREMATRLFQQWALAFEPKRELSFLPEMYREMKNSGIEFPPPPAPIPSHLLTTATPPTWADSDSCQRCRTAFTFTNRKHHCRNCGLVFDQACSSRQMTLPSLGIMTEVRVCEGCWSKSPKGKKEAQDKMNGLISGGGGGLNGIAPAVPSKRTPRSKLDMDADLQRAIALSLAESSPSGSSRPGYVPSEPPTKGRKLHGTDELDEDEQLRMAIEESLREMEKVRPSAPVGGEAEEPEYKPLPTYDLTPREAETMLTFAQTIDHAVGFGDPDLRRFPHAHALYEQANLLSGKLARNVEEKGTKQQMLSEMHERLMQAIKRYDGLLTEQEAYSRRQEEERQRQQQAQQYGAYRPYASQAPYGYGLPPDPYRQGAPPQQYGMPPQMTGQYAPPPPVGYDQYQAPPSAAPPSMYPSLPPQSQAYPQQRYPQHQEAQWGTTATPTPTSEFPPSAPPQLQRQTSMSHAAPSVPPSEIPQNSWAQGHPYSQQQAQAPPPEQQVYATSPSAAYHAPSQQHSQSPPQPIASSPPKEQYQSYQTMSSPQPQPALQQQSYPSQVIYPSAAAAAAPQQQQQPQQLQQEYQQPYSNGNAYSQAPNFPAFPSAPSDLPLPMPEVPKEEPKEAMLIEL